MAYKVTKDELNYYAGFFDGEGCIMINKRGRPYYTLNIAITSTDKCILEDFEQVFGGKIYGAYKSKLRYKDKWNWVIGANKALAFLKAVYPYLRLKKEEAELGIKFQKRPKWIRDPILRAKQEAVQDTQYELMKKLKRRIA